MAHPSNIFAALSFANDGESIRRINIVGDNLLEANKNIPGLQWFLTYQSLPRVYVERSLERGGNILGLDREPGNNIRAFSLSLPANSPHLGMDIQLTPFSLPLPSHVGFCRGRHRRLRRDRRSHRAGQGRHGAARHRA